MEANKKKLVIYGGVLIVTFGLGFLAYNQLKKKGITIKLGS
jgi:hypothetical protein